MGHWIQVKSVNLGVTYTGGYCLKGVADAFGTPHIFPTASADWQSGENGKGNHDNEQPPSGVQVPIYLKLGNVPAGDVAISLGDGRVAACAQSGTHNGLYIYPSLQAYINDYSKYNGGATYLGWSEGTENTRVVKYIPDITTKDSTQVTSIPFTEETQEDSTLPVGQSKTVQVGVNGSRTIVTRTTYSDGNQTGSTVVSDVTVPPAPHIVANGTKQPDPVPDPTPVPTPEPVNPTPPVPTVPIGFLQTIIDFLTYLVKNIILGVK